RSSVRWGTPLFLTAATTDIRGCIASGISIAGFFIRACMVFIFLLSLLLFRFCYRAGILRGLIMLTFGDCAFRHFPKIFRGGLRAPPLTRNGGLGSRRTNYDGWEAVTP